MGHRIFGILLTLTLSLAGTAQSQTADSGECAKASQIYEQQSGQCADYNQQLADLRVRIDAFKRNNDAALAECRRQKNQKNCEELRKIYSGNLSTLEQEYAVRASHGCQTVPQAAVMNACKTGLKTKQSLAKKPRADASAKPRERPAATTNGAGQANITPVVVSKNSKAPGDGRQFSATANGMSGSAAQGLSGRSTAGTRPTSK